MMLSLGISLAGKRAKAAGGGQVPDAGVSFLATAVGSIEADKATGDLTVTVTQPAAYAGTYTQDADGNTLNAANLATGPQALVAPIWQGDGSPEVGETQSFRRGLWVYGDTLGTPTVTYDIVRDGAAALVTDASYSGSNSYTPVPGDGGTSLTVVETAAQGASSRTATSTALAIPAEAGFSLLETAEGRIEVDNVTGDLTVTIDSPAAYAGTYTQDIDGSTLTAANLATGPQALVAPIWQDDGTPEIGEAQSFLRGLWIYDTSQDEPTITHDVVRNGTTVLVDDASYTGSDSYTPSTAGALTIVETATQGGPARSATSNALPVSGGAVDATWLGQHDVTGLNLTTRTASGMDLGAAAAGREIIVIYTGRFGGGKPAIGAWECSVGSTTLTPIGVYGGTLQAMHLVWRGTVQTGTSADVTLTRIQGSTVMFGGAFGLVRATGAPVLEAPVVVGNTALPGDGSAVLDVSLEVDAGDALIVAGAASNKLNGSGFVFAGVTERVDGGHANGGGALAFEAGLPAGAPRAITVRVTGEATGADASAAAWRIRA